MRDKEIVAFHNYNKFKIFSARKEIWDLVKVLLQLALLVFRSPHINHRNLFISTIFVHAAIKIRRSKAQGA